MGRRLLIAAVVAASLGTMAPSASAKCAPDADPVECWINCTLAQLAGALCKS